MTQSLTDVQLTASLRSSVCPACGRWKRSAYTLCGSCYHDLPVALRKPLYRRVGSGYAEAFGAAMDELGVETPRLPLDP